MSSVPAARRAEPRRKQLMARQRGHRLASEPKRGGLAQAQLLQPWASPRPGSQIECGDLASIDAVPYVKAPGLTGKRQSARRRKPLPGGVDKGLSACHVRLRARRPASQLSQSLRRAAGYAPAGADWRAAGRPTPLAAGPVG